MEVLTFEGREYLIEYPEGYQQGKRYPVVMFLHGAGTRGDDIAVLKGNMFMQMTKKYAEFSFITIAPHCKHGTWIDNFGALQRFTKAIAAADYTDPERLYLIGNSMGGYGTWFLAMSLPEYFAAAMPICGGGMPWNAETLVNVPIWAFHGEIDDIVDVNESKSMVAAVNRCGGNARITLYPGVYHDSWTPTYNNRAVFEWLFSQRNENAKKIVDSYAQSTQIYG